MHIKLLTHRLDCEDETGTPKDKIDEKPKLINEARRKIKGMLNFYK